MDIQDSQRIKEIRDNTAKVADAFTRIADALERLAGHKTEPQTEGYMTEEQAEDYRKMIDKAEHKVYGNIADTPQTDETEAERLDRIDNEIEDAWARIKELTPQTDCGWK